MVNGMSMRRAEILFESISDLESSAVMSSCVINSTGVVTSDYEFIVQKSPYGPEAARVYYSYVTVPRAASCPLGCRFLQTACYRTFTLTAKSNSK